MTEPRPTRFRQLDGLRGAAAVVVVLSHVLFVVPALAEDRPRGVTRRAAGTVGWLRDTPIHLLWDGEGAVALFFVLSGVVLTMSVRSSVRWRDYYPRRLLRLYLPTILSVLWAVVMILAVPRRPQASWWLTSHAHRWGMDAIRSVILLGGVRGIVNSPLWSLQWEVWFSLLLPAYLFLARSVRRIWAGALVTMVLFILAGYRLRSDELIYLPYFALGMLLALHRERVSHWLRVLPQTVWIVCALGLASLRFIPEIGSESMGHLGLAVGAALGVGALLRPGGVTALLERPVLQWLGKISFSLYLVHEPIVVSFGQWHAPFALTLPLAFVTSLIAGWLFWRVAESPLHQRIRTLSW